MGGFFLRHGGLVAVWVVVYPAVAGVLDGGRVQSVGLERRAAGDAAHGYVCDGLVWMGAGIGAGVIGGGLDNDEGPGGLFEFGDVAVQCSGTWFMGQKD